MSDIKVGEKYTLPNTKFSGVWTVVKVNPVNTKLVQYREDGTVSARLTAHPSFLVPEGQAAPPVVTKYVEPLREGTVVTVKSSKIKGLHVVARSNAKTVTVVPLGGKGSGWRVSPSSLTEVPLDEVKAAL